MHDLPLSSLLSSGRPLLSYEFFPPKTDEGASALRETIHALVPTAPDFVTVTYGAGGSTRARSSEVVRDLISARLAPVIPHLTCVGSSRADLTAIISEIHASGRRNIMCLRGDPPKGQTSFTAPARVVGALAGDPEGHPEAVSQSSEMEYLARKVAAGASYITTQLFFDNAAYFDFVARCRAAGITVPVLPGLLPISSLAQTRRFSSLCGAHLPEALIRRLERLGGEGEAAEDAGIEWCAEQIDGLLAGGAPGVHLYILNRSRAALSRPLVDHFKRYKSV